MFITLQSALQLSCLLFCQSFISFCSALSSASRSASLFLKDTPAKPTLFLFMRAREVKAIQKNPKPEAGRKLFYTFSILFCTDFSTAILVFVHLSVLFYTPGFSLGSADCPPYVPLMSPPRPPCPDPKAGRRAPCFVSIRIFLKGIILLLFSQPFFLLLFSLKNSLNSQNLSKLPYGYITLSPAQKRKHGKRIYISRQYKSEQGETTR